MRNLMITIGAAVSLAAAVCGCSGKDADAGKAAANQVHKKAAQTANGLSAGMVAAVAPPGTGPSTVEVKFELQGHPDVAQPLDVDVVIVPVFGAVERISGKFTADDGLEVVSGQDIPAAEKPVEGTPIHYTVRVLPKHDGVFTLTATLNVDAAGRSTSQIFSMPVIVGAGPPAEAGTAHPAAATQ
jgi:hypothetical protein